MNYYEELGVSQEASGEEIRKAHRRLVKLMHPDAQLDQGLKGLAETQMRRLNSIVSTLLDPDQRRAYDEQLRNDSMPYTAAHSRGAWRGIPWWLASVAGAVVLTLIAVYLWADHAGSSFGRSNRTIYVRPVENPPLASERPYPVTTAPDPTLTAKIEDSHNDFPPVPAAHGAADPLDSPGGISATVVNPDSRSSEVAAPGSGSAAAMDPPAVKPALPAIFPHADPPLVTHKPVTPVVTKPVPRVAAPETAKPKVAPQEAAKRSFKLPASELVGQAHIKDVRNGGQMPPPPGLSSSNVTQHDDTTVAMNSAPLPMALAPRVEGGNIPSAPSRSGASSKPHDPLEGEWIYAPKEPERRKPGFYPPEFIDLKLFSAGDPGNLKGQYNARYVITDKPISPEVSFQFASVDKDSRKFVWQGTNGTHGTIAIHPVDDNTIRIEWRTTSSVRGPSLTSGAATLVRRQ
jgi:hypothetical protein